ncbi:YIEGIA family protein [Brassicibacter mesophilus]|uniref:YIEGIA family protein n=1 Tax=Brassicibacter mesophilus TaxID=745119 RepID=UPI003D194A55
MEQKGLLELSVVLYILTGTLVGFLGRLWMLRSDIRQYPTYPNGYLIHLTTGFIAAAMGAVAYPALLAKNYVAVTFLALAIQQFRDIRKMEKESLKSLERENYFFRGDAYIDGIAKTFEARNYIVMVSSLITTISAFIIKQYSHNKVIIMGISVIIGIAVIYFLKNYTKGHNIKDIADIEQVQIEFKNGDNLYVGDTYVMNIGLSATRERILKNGFGIILKPKGENEKVLLNHEGQRTAILHECTRILGLERYAATRRNFDNGEVALFIVPIIKDVKLLKEIINNVPILETLKKKDN